MQVDCNSTLYRIPPYAHAVGLRPRGIRLEDHSSEALLEDRQVPLNFLSESPLADWASRIILQHETIALWYESEQPDSGSNYQNEPIMN